MVLSNSCVGVWCRGADVSFCFRLHAGECSETCLFNSVCLVEQRGSRCSCEPILCDGAYRPLCGQDGNTYANDCERQRAECLARAHIPVKHQGPCGR